MCKLKLHKLLLISAMEYHSSTTVATVLCNSRSVFYVGTVIFTQNIFVLQH